MDKRSQIIASLLSVATIVVVAIVSLAMFEGIPANLKTAADVNPSAQVELYFLPETNTASLGSRITEALMVDSGRAVISSLSLTMSYDPTKFSYVGFQPNQNMVGTPVVEADESNGKIFYKLDSVELSFIKTLGTFDFKTVQAGSAVIGFENLSVTADNSAIEPKAANASLTIK